MSQSASLHPTSGEVKQSLEAGLERPRPGTLRLYEHLAVLATASAACNIEWVAPETGQSENLSAQLRRPDGTVEPFPKTRWIALPGKIQTMSGLALTGRLEFSRWTVYERAFPEPIDQALLADGYDAALAISRLTLELPESDPGGIIRRVGLKAMHTVGRGIPHPTIEPINEMAGLEAFQGLFSLLHTVSDGTASYAALTSYMEANEARSRYQRDPHGHFALHQNPGIPPDTIAAASQNFAGLATFTEQYSPPPLT